MTPLVAACLLVGASTLPAGARPSLIAAIRPVGAVDVVALHAEALAVLTRDEQAAVDQATNALNTATGQRDAVTATLAQDRRSSASAVVHATDAAQTLATVTAAHVAAVAAHQAAITALGTDRGRLAQIGVALYVGPPPAIPDVAQDLTGVETAADGALYLTNGDHQLTSLISADRRRIGTTASIEARLAQQVTGDRATAAAASQTRDSAAAAVTGDAAALVAAQQATTAAQATVTSATKTMADAVAALGAPSADGSPTIMGTPAMVPAQLSAWFNSTAYSDAAQAPIAQLAAWYVSEGRAEGVRGDVAFAQAIVETGGFSSPDAINLNNYAGVGHCDSCAAGLSFPSAQGGVRGQVQLLRIFANPAGTPLTQPAIIPAVAVGGQFRGACCPSWQSLTGTWATDPQYGQTVLTVYKRILDFALSQPPVIPGSAADGSNATAAPTTAPTVAAG